MQLKKCEACENIRAMIRMEDLLEGSNPETFVCHNCLIALVNLSLTPEQYQNLIRNGHTPNEYLLHNDFYDECGNALQPKGKRDPHAA